MTAPVPTWIPSALVPGVELRGPFPEGADRVLTAEAVAFVADLVRRFSWRIEELLAVRAQTQKKWDSGWRPSFPTDSRHIRETAWTVAPLPSDLTDRRVEITGPVDRKMIINALNSGANVFMADFEDSNSPTRENVVSGQLNLQDAVRRTITFTAPDSGKQYRLNEKTAVLFVRPRGLHLPEKHFRVDSKPAPGCLVDFGLYVFHNAAELVRRGTGPYLYLPKMESHLEARLWNDVFLRAQEKLSLPRGTIKATVLIETLPASFQMDEILWELKEHSAGLNCGRWDYIFSFIKKQRLDPAAVLPDRAQVTMDKGFLNAYVQLLIQTCHRRGVHAMGGMAAQIPIKDDRAASDAALSKVRADKLREVKAGHDGTWVAHPGLVSVAKAVFDEHMQGPNQLAVKREDVRITEKELLKVPEGTRTEDGLRHSIRVSVQYLESWLRGSGCVPLYNLMEDAATAEISRAQVWQWIHHGAELSDRRKVTKPLFLTLLEEEMARVRREVGEQRFLSGRFAQARSLFERISTADGFEEFLTLPAYDLLVGEGETSAASAPAHPDPARWSGLTRSYSPDLVERLRGSIKVEHTLARLGSERLWDLLKSRPMVTTLGALTGGQAVQMVKAGLESIYVSGWQVAADANTAGQTYPDQSLYPADSVPSVVKRINRALQRADQIEASEGSPGRYWFAPIVADAEAGFGGPLNAYELTRAMIEAGAAGVHFEDQLASEKKCGHLGGKVLVPTSTFVRTLTAARLAADVMGVPTLIIARTDAHAATLLVNDVDPADAPFIDRSKGRTSEGFFHLRPGVEAAIARAVAYAPYADMIWCETSTPDLAEARRFAEGVHARFPGKLLAYNCSPSFNWRKHLSETEIGSFQRELASLGYRFQFVTLAGFHALNHATFQLAAGYRDRGMSAYSDLQQEELAAERLGYTATRHQREVGTGYFDLVTDAVSGGTASTKALEGSTEAAQFKVSDRLSAAQEVVDEDHRALGKLLGQLRSVSREQVLHALEELDSYLHGHFAREEAPDGLHGIVVRRAPQFRPDFDSISREHDKILSAVTGIVAGARRGVDVERRELVELLGALREHEIRETTVTRQALGK